MANAVKLVSKPANTRFHPYLGNSTFDGRKITSKVQKNANAVKPFSKPANTFFSLLSCQTYLRLTQKNLQIAKNRTVNAIKSVSKPVNTFWPYLGNSTSD